MAKGEVRIPNDVVDDLGYGDELAAWVWLTRTRDYVTGEPQISVRKLADLTGWHKNKAHRFLLKFRRDTSGTLTGQQRDTSGTDVEPPEPIAADKRDSNGTLTGQQRDTSGTHNKESKNQVIKESRTTTTTGFQIPDWIPKEPWEAWMAVRKKKRAAQTPYALGLAVGILEKHRDAGGNVTAALNKAVLRNWTGLELAWLQDDGQRQQPKTFRELDNEQAAKDIRERDAKRQRLHLAVEAEERGASPDVVQAIADGRAGPPLQIAAKKEPDVPY